MHNELSKVKKMEMKYALKDPKHLKADLSYLALGPIGLCEFIQEKFSVLFVEQDLPTLVSEMLAANNFSVDSEKTGDQKVNSRVRT